MAYKRTLFSSSTADKREQYVDNFVKILQNAKNDGIIFRNLPSNFYPSNFKHEQYNGVNYWNLMFASNIAGYRTPIFTTFANAKDNKFSISRGEKGHSILFFNITITNKKTKKQIPYNEYLSFNIDKRNEYLYKQNISRSTVFNLDQTTYEEVYKDEFKELVKNYPPKENNVMAIEDNELNPNTEEAKAMKKILNNISAISDSDIIYTDDDGNIHIPTDIIPTYKNYNQLLYTIVISILHKTGIKDNVKPFIPLIAEMVVATEISYDFPMRDENIRSIDSYLDIINELNDNDANKLIRQILSTAYKLNRRMAEFNI